MPDVGQHDQVRSRQGLLQLVCRPGCNRAITVAVWMAAKPAGYAFETTRWGAVQLIRNSDGGVLNLDTPHPYTIEHAATKMLMNSRMLSRLSMIRLCFSSSVTFRLLLAGRAESPLWSG